MADEHEGCHGPSATAPTPTYRLVYCVVCKTERVWKGPADSQGGCSFCGASNEAIRIRGEYPTYRNLGASLRNPTYVPHLAMRKALDRLFKKR